MILAVWDREHMRQNLLEVQNLRTYFFTRRGVVKAVDGVSFSVREGETLGLVGESGCGKSITCFSLLRLVPEPAGKIVGGRILLEGEDILLKSGAEMRRIRGKKISIIFQDPLTSLNPAYSVGDQVGEAIAIHQKAKGRTLVQRVIEALRLVQIPAAEVRLHDYPHQLSGGMRQRVAGAIALSCQPCLLIADEPTTCLDLTIQAQYLKLLKELQQESKAAMIFVTHDFGIVARMCDRVAVMYAGKIVETAATRELFNNPRHPYTIALMGCLPRLEVEQERLVTIGGQPPHLIDLPKGCSFAPRCPRSKEICWQQYPDEVPAGDGHFVSCWLAA